MSTSYYEDYYDVLMVPVAADAAAIRAAFHALIWQCHPDCAEQHGSQDKASQIIKAYKTLSHPERRQQYDRRRVHRLMPAGSERRSGERRQPANRLTQIHRWIDRGRAAVWGVSVGATALVVGVTFWPDLLVSRGDISRDLLRALI